MYDALEHEETENSWLNTVSVEIRKAQSTFSGAAETIGISSEEDVQSLVDEVRYGKEM